MKNFAYLLYICFDAGASQTVQGDAALRNEPNMCDAKAVKQEKKIGHHNEPKEVAQRVQCVSYHSMLLLCFSIIALTGVIKILVPLLVKDYDVIFRDDSRGKDRKNFSSE